MRKRNTSLQDARMRKGMSQKRVAQALGIALRTYQNYEYCKRGLSLDMASKIAELLEVSIDTLSVRNSTPKSEKTEIA